MKKYSRYIILIIAVLCPLFAIYGIWDPVIRAFHLEQIEVSDDIIQSSRDYPDVHVIQALSAVKIGGAFPESFKKNIENIADQLMRGVVNLDTYHSRNIKIPFDRQAVFSGNSHWRLSYASFLIPEIYLNAYIKTSETKYLMAARDFILGWDKFEQEIWSPESFVWNDHAVAARSQVVGDFWYHYKSHGDFDVETARKIIRMAARDGAFLVRDLNYTFKTNHGTMQNLALLKLVLYFPEIAEIQQMKKIAAQKLIEQYDFFINEDGVILEHSAEYHAFGLNLISATFTLFDLLEMEIPGALVEKYNRGLVFLKALRRPDGTLPKLGDTSEKFDDIGQRLLTDNPTVSNNIQPDNDTALKAMSAYAVWWSGLTHWPAVQKLTQTAITWAYFPFMGHKHADELSFILWKGGQEWWTNIGYWPYTDSRRTKAVSWTGSNAPHLVGEAMNSKRRSSILSHHADKNIKLIDLQRTRPDGFKARRQIVNISDKVWITLDSFDDNQQRQGQAIWTLHPSLYATSLKGNEHFRAISDKTKHVMDIFFRGGSGMTIRKVHGQENPMAGWVGSIQSVFPADAFIARQKSDGGWLGTISIIGENADNRSADIRWSSPEEWQVDLTYEGKQINVSRSGNQLSQNNRNEEVKIKVTAISENVQSQEKISAAYYAAEKKHGKRFLPLISFRVKITKILAGLFVVNIVFLILFRRKMMAAAALSIFSYAGLYFWLVNHYFIVSP